LQTNGATDIEVFQIGDSLFLAVANAYNYGPQNINKKQEYFTNSTIYKLDKGRRVFKTFQTIETFRYSYNDTFRNSKVYLYIFWVKMTGSKTKI
jgi:hypothetical protein